MSKQPSLNSLVEVKDPLHENVDDISMSVDCFGVPVRDRCITDAKRKVESEEGLAGVGLTEYLPNTCLGHYVLDIPYWFRACGPVAGRLETARPIVDVDLNENAGSVFLGQFDVDIRRGFIPDHRFSNRLNRR